MNLSGIIIKSTVLGAMQNMTTEMQYNAIKEFWGSLPEKVLNLSVRILFAVVFFLIGVQLIKLLRKIIRKSMSRANVELGAIQFVDSFVKAALYVVLTLMLASSFGVDAASIVALLGSAGVAIGLAIQGSLSNLAGGVLILMLKPFKVGDYIKEGSGGMEGTVEEIQIFYTKLLTPDNQTVILPNGNLANSSLVNVTAQEFRRMDIKVGISYKAELKKAKEVLREVLLEEEAVQKDKDMLVFVDELGSSSVVLGVRCWLTQEDFWSAKWRITENCKLKLEENEIEIPYNQLDVHLDGKP